MALPVTLRNLGKRFGSTTAVDAVNLTVAGGQRFFLLGPSGCGKTTILRMIAGFVEPTQGSIQIGERDVTGLPPHRRQTAMVFQNYALWPHMTVAANVAFGLQMRRRPASECRQRARAALAAVRMEDLANREPAELSGGQQQRVALARALVVEPAVLLLDEPLSNLDARLRVELRQQIVQVCRDAGITSIHVTHDQREALSMADAIAVMDRGKVVQVGSPRELYRRPVNRFVADFLGETNFIPATVKGRENGLLLLETPMGSLASAVAGGGMAGDAENASPGKTVMCSVRPEAIRLLGGLGDSSTPAVNCFTARRVETTYLGETAQHVLALSENLRIKALELNPGLTATSQEQLAITIDPLDVAVLAES